MPEEETVEVYLLFREGEIYQDGESRPRMVEGVYQTQEAAKQEIVNNVPDRIKSDYWIEKREVISDE